MIRPERAAACPASPPGPLTAVVLGAERPASPPHPGRLPPSAPMLAVVTTFGTGGGPCPSRMVHPLFFGTMAKQCGKARPSLLRIRQPRSGCMRESVHRFARPGTGPHFGAGTSCATIGPLMHPQERLKCAKVAAAPGTALPNHGRRHILSSARQRHHVSRGGLAWRTHPL